jgi:hypothetical protein
MWIEINFCRQKMYMYKPKVFSLICDKLVEITGTEQMRLQQKLSEN